MEFTYVKNKLLRFWPLLAALAALGIIFIFCLVRSLQLTDGHISYALDDAYIHMAMAKNITQHGVYGVSQYEFTSSSSSPLWTIFLAGFYFIIGAREWLPLFLNLFIASAVLLLIERILTIVAASTPLKLITLCSILLCTPFPALIFGGMEHLLHILIVIVFVWEIAKNIVEKEKPAALASSGWLCVLAIAATMARFESYALVFLACGFFLMRKKWKLAFGLALAALLPLLVYQYISVSKGWSWLPNSIIIRTDSPQLRMFNSHQVFTLYSPTAGITGFFKNFVKNISSSAHVYGLVLVAVVLLVSGWKRMKSFWHRGPVLLAVYILLVLTHMQFARTGHFFRYEAYLVALGFFTIAYAWAELQITIPWKPFSWKKAMVGIFGIAFLYFSILPLEFRARKSLELIPRATCNIYEQQVQMGLFLKHFYPDAVVAANDIGAISFFGDIHLLDLVGLASTDVLALKQSGTYTTDQLYLLAKRKDVDVAMVYDSWFELENLKGVPPEWIRVGGWVIENNVVCGGDVVSFYAVKPSERDRLINALRMFSYMLPRTVKQFGFHLMTNDAQNILRIP